MELELGPFPRYENERTHAFWARAEIDTRLRVDDYGIDYYKLHMQDCKKNPTVGYLLRHKYITGKPMNYPISAKRNLRYLEKKPEIDYLKKSIDNDTKTLYPKTRHIREYIIEKERVVLDWVEKSKKYSTFDRLKIFLKRFQKGL